MPKIICIIVTVLSLIFIFGCGNSKDSLDDHINDRPQQNNGEMVTPSTPSDEEKQDLKNQQIIEEQLKRMSLEEKLGQLLITGISGTTLTDETIELISKYKVGGIIFYSANLPEPATALELINQIKKENANNAIPLFLSVDQEGGLVSRLPGFTKLPTNKQIGEQNNVELSYTIGTILGQQLRAYGLNMNFAPVLDVNSNPHNPVIGDRSFSNDPVIVRDLGIATMKGMQEKRIIPVVKHFPGHGDTAVDSHLELPILTKNIEQLSEIELLPFQQAIEQGVDVIMIAHILLPELDEDNPASMSKAIITDLLRDKLGYDGLVITDDLTMQAITKYYDIATAAVSSIIAGSDMVMIAHDYNAVLHTIAAFKDALQAGVLTEERIDESVKRILQLKHKYSLSNEIITQLKLDEINEHIEDIRQFLH